MVSQWQMRSIETYRNGVKDGPYSKYCDNGQESQKGIFEQTKESVCGCCGTKMEPKTRVIFRDGEIAFSLSSFGMTMARCITWKRSNGRLNGNQTTRNRNHFWFANGSKDRHLFRIGGKLDGKELLHQWKLRKKSNTKKVSVRSICLILPGWQ